MSKVLVVDDNEINSLLALNILMSLGLAAEAAESGEKAVEMAGRYSYDLILMDNIMPGISGIEATRQIISRRKNAIIYAMTGELTDKVREDFKSAGASGVLMKPLDYNEVIAIVRKVLPAGTYVIPDSSNAQTDEREDVDEEQELKNSLSPIAAELDLEKGLAGTAGSIDIYIKILGAAVNNIRQYADIINEYVPGTDVMPIKFAVHSLKSVFANIGHEWLRRDSERIEQQTNIVLAGGGEAGKDRERLESVLEAYNERSLTFVSKLEVALSDYNQRVAKVTKPEFYISPESPLSDSDFAETIAYTRTALARCEIDYLTEGLELLIAASTGDNRRSLEQALEYTSTYSYDEVAKILDQIFA